MTKRNELQRIQRLRKINATQAMRRATLSPEVRGLENTTRFETLKIEKLNRQIDNYERARANCGDLARSRKLGELIDQRLAQISKLEKQIADKYGC